MKKVISIVLCTALVASSCLFNSCSTMSKLAEGSIIGGAAGAATGAAAGALIGKDGKSTAIGAAIGTAVGAGVGALIGHKMDKKAEELKALENAQVETVTDVNGLEGVKVTFASGILFKTNSSTLNADSKAALKEFAAQMADLPETDITILGHTDNTGTLEVNEKVSAKRAASVEAYLETCGIAADRMKTAGRAYNEPVASNDTEEGRAQNRRVEIYITANENMIKAAEEGTLK